MARLTVLLVALVAAMAQAFAPNVTPVTRSAAVPTALPVKVKVEVGEGEPIESALRRFKRQVNQSGHLMELRHRRYFENSQERKKRKIVQARFRKRMERMQARRMRQQRTQEEEDCAGPIPQEDGEDAGQAHETAAHLRSSVCLSPGFSGLTCKDVTNI